MWGVITTFSISHNALSGGSGSCPVTSSPAPASRPEVNASTIAFSETTRPRDTLIR